MVGDPPPSVAGSAGGDRGHQNRREPFKRPLADGLLKIRDTLMRLVRTHAEAAGGPTVALPEVAALVTRLQAREA